MKRIGMAGHIGLLNKPCSNKKGLRAYWTPLKILSKVLFWGKVSEISGGQMPNKVTGATDFLTVAGSPYTFQCPNTAPYIAADTDYIWFKTDASQRITTTAELIGYDLQRTPVKYLDDAPNTIEDIVILKAGESLTAGERDDLFKYMHLSILWDNSFNDNGRLKSNRALEQLLWKPEYDSSTVALLARMGTQPSVALADLIDKTILDLKSNDIWSSLKQFTKANIHNETDAKLNWIGNTFPITVAGGTPFTAKQGWACKAGGRYLKSGFVPATEITAGTIGEADCGFLIDKYLSQSDLANYKMNGSWKTTTMQPRFALVTYSTNSKKLIANLNCSYDGITIQSDDIASANGVCYAERDGNTIYGYYEGIKVFEYTVSGSAATNDNELYFGALQNQVDTAVYFAMETYRTIILCRKLGATKQLALYNILKYFNDNVGSTF